MTGEVRLLTHGALKAIRTKTRYLIHQVIPRRDLTVVWGKPKSGKTFWVLDIALHVALGWDYHGRRVEKGAVIYCPFEGRDGIVSRLDAFCAGHEITSAPDSFLILADRLTFGKVMPKGHDRLISAITETGVKPALVILDTLNRSLDGSENDDQDMTFYTKAAETIADKFECAVVIVHHCGTAGDRPRGHTSLTGTCACQINVSRSGERGTSSDMITATVELMKDGPEGFAMHNWLTDVELGKDEDGLPETSCYLTAAPPPTHAAKAVKGNSAASKALAVLEKLIQDNPGERPTMQAWRDACASKVGKGSIDSKRKAFRRAVDTLKEEGVIDYDGPFIVMIESDAR